MRHPSLLVERRDRLRPRPFAARGVHQTHGARAPRLRQGRAHHVAALVGFGDDLHRLELPRRRAHAARPAERRQAQRRTIGQHIGSRPAPPGDDDPARGVRMSRRRIDAHDHALQAFRARAARPLQILRAP
ncbi:MAG: hypothetical protein BroJett013_17040 [Alphaproteobacteria bacterium]|nr:MAG: hypothetical protein BroJett013_17040 [Alphaproteobacteria bacterium]